jgi:hypothetical protein
MTESTRPKARGKMLLSTGVLVAALFAALALAPLASATPDPVASGSATITLNKSWTKYLGTFGIKAKKTGSAKLKGQKATFKVTGGEMDPTNGLGSLTLSGGIKFAAGKKSAPVTGLVLESAKNVLTGKVAGKKVKLATTSGLSFARNGFGVNVTLKKLKLNSQGAKQLNAKLGFAKGKPKPFLGNKVIGSAASEDQPSTVTVLPAGSMTFTGAPTLFGKLADDKVVPQPLGTTTLAGATFTGPITGGTVSPAATSGTVMSGIGLNLVQNLPTEGAPIATTITLGGVYVDLAGKTATVEVVATSNAKNAENKEPLNLGNLGRSSVADITVSGVVANPATRTVAVSAAGVLQPVSATVLNGFTQVYAGYVEKVTFETAVKKEGKSEAEAGAAAKGAGAAVTANDTIVPGEALGTFAFTAQAQ